MTALSLIRLSPDRDHFAQWAARNGFLPPSGDDLGYALHAAFAKCFGQLAPKPFYWREGVNSAGPELFGYCPGEPDTVLESLSIPALDGALETGLNLGSIQARAMPGSWRSGRTLSFETRTRPIVRQNREGDRRRFREVDAAAHAARLAPLEAPPSKRDVYLEWTAAQLAPAAEIISGGVTAMGRTRVLRRPIRDGSRSSAMTEGPDVTVTGILRIGDAAAFGELVRRGVGRHRAFGFGMLLLAPPGAL